MVIFGSTGDLTKRKLFPALYYLLKDGFLPDNFAIIGVGRQEMSTDEFRKKILDELTSFVEVKHEDKLVKWFAQRTYYTGGDFDDDKVLFQDIKDLIAQAEETHDIPKNYFYYMAIPPSFICKRF